MHTFPDKVNCVSSPWNHNYTILHIYCSHILHQNVSDVVAQDTCNLVSRVLRRYRWTFKNISAWCIQNQSGFCDLCQKQLAAPCDSDWAVKQDQGRKDLEGVTETSCVIHRWEFSLSDMSWGWNVFKSFRTKSLSRWSFMSSDFAKKFVVTDHGSAFFDG